jgi:lysozyme
MGLSPRGGAERPSARVWVNKDLARILEREEGRVAHAYRDTEGLWTIGVGFLIDEKRGAGLYPEEIDWILANRIRRARLAVDVALPWAQALEPARYGALILMAYQMGIGDARTGRGLLGFRMSLRLIQAGEWQAAAAALRQSKWARQTPQRAARVIKQIVTGEWQ